jgi:hypothetical protein
MNIISNNKVCIEETGLCYTIARLDEFETNQSFKCRIEYVKKKKPMTQKEFDIAIQYSQIVVNKWLLGCSYSPDVEKNL